MCFPVTDHKADCGCSACLLRKEENRKWQRMLKNPALRKRKLNRWGENARSACDAARTKPENA